MWSTFISSGGLFLNKWHLYHFATVVSMSITLWKFIGSWVLVLLTDLIHIIVFFLCHWTSSKLRFLNWIKACFIKLFYIRTFISAPFSILKVSYLEFVNAVRLNFPVGSFTADAFIITGTPEILKSHKEHIAIDSI